MEIEIRNKERNREEQRRTEENRGERTVTAIYSCLVFLTMSLCALCLCCCNPLNLYYLIWLLLSLISPCNGLLFFKDNPNRELFNAGVHTGVYVYIMNTTLITRILLHDSTAQLSAAPALRHCVRYRHTAARCLHRILSPIGAPHVEG